MHFHWLQSDRSEQLCIRTHIAQVVMAGKEANVGEMTSNNEEESIHGQSVMSLNRSTVTENAVGDVAKGDNSVNLNIMMNRKPVLLEDIFSQKNVTMAVAYGDVQMPVKLYSKKMNLSQFVETQLVDEWKISTKWVAWLKTLDFETKIHKNEVLEKVKTAIEARNAYEITDCAFSLTVSYVRDLFKEYDGKKKVHQDLLLNEDNRFLHLLVDNTTFSKTTIADLQYYLRDCCCYEEAVRFILKFHTEKFDEELLKEYCNHRRLRVNRRFCEIILFISQFFGRAELVMKDSQVKELWNALSFLNEFVMALLEQCQMVQEKFLSNPSKRIVGSRNESDDEESDGMEDIASSLGSRSIVEEKSVSKGSAKRRASIVLAGSMSKKLQTEEKMEVVEEKESTASLSLVVSVED